MNYQTDVALQVLARVSAFLRGLSEAEVEALAAGDSRLTLTTRKRAPSAKIDIASLQERLAVAQTREEAARVLREPTPTRAVLQRVARALDLPVVKSDTSDMLVERIIEGTVGYRLNSKAVRGHD